MRRVKDEEKAKKQRTHGLVGMRQRVTAFKSLENKRTWADETFRRFLDSAPDAMVYINEHGKILLVNAQTERLFGYAREELIGQGVEILLPERFQDQHVEHRKSYFSHPRVRPMGASLDLSGRRKDDTEFPVEISLSPIETEEGVLVSAAIRDITERKKAEQQILDYQQQLRNALSEVEQLKNQLQAENIYLRKEVKLSHKFGEMIGQSDALKEALHKAEQVASTDATVLILGETGTGKELVARAIHNLSPRKERPLVSVNCAALPPTLIESELFGHEKGAFTGASSQQAGRFEMANGGTIFLDEIGDLPRELQAKLLRVLQEREFLRVGGSRPVTVDVRVIVATHRDLEQAIKVGDFREDLYYRLNVFPISLPPLRDRIEDIPLLVRYFTHKYGTMFGKRIESIPQKVMDMLQAYRWPGNVRELENIIERAVILASGSAIGLGEALESVRPSDLHTTSSLTLAEVERNHILGVLEKTGWRIEGEHGAAVRLRLNPSTLRSRMKRLGIKKERRAS